jgi:hypothetical protein
MDCGVAMNDMSKKCPASLKTKPGGAQVVGRIGL